MRLSAESHRKFEKFFREYFRDESLKLPEIHVYCRRGSWIFTKILMVDGITFGRHIFIKPEHLRTDSEGKLVVSKELLAHELAHTLQYRRHGVFGFLSSYVGSFFGALRRKEKWNLKARVEAYLEIPHEIEARDCASAFLRFDRRD
jgi:hypothetical protein